MAISFNSLLILKILDLQYDKQILSTLILLFNKNYHQIFDVLIHIFFQQYFDIPF
jgi:hypothetical protein